MVIFILSDYCNDRHLQNNPKITFLISYTILFLSESSAEYVPTLDSVIHYHPSPPHIEDSDNEPAPPLYLCNPTLGAMSRAGRVRGLEWETLVFFYRPIPNGPPPILTLSFTRSSTQSQ